MPSARFSLKCGGIDDAHFDGLALAVKLLEFLGQLIGPALVARGEKFERQVRMADAACRIEPRAQHKAQGIDIGAALEAGNIAQHGKAQVLAPRHDLQALRDIGAVQALQGHDIADGGERHEFQPLQHVGFGPRWRIPALGAQQFVDGGHEDHHHAGGTEIAEARDIILPVGIDHRMGLGKNFACLVMVNDDGFHAEFRRMGQGIMGEHTAIQGEQQVAALLFQKFHRVFAGAIAFGQAVRHVDDGVRAHGAEKQLEDCGGGNAIDIIVADDADAGLGDDGFGQTCRALLHVLQRRRVAA